MFLYILETCVALGDLRLVLSNKLWYCISNGRHIDYCTKALSDEICFALLRLDDKINFKPKNAMFFYYQ